MKVKFVVFYKNALKHEYEYFADNEQELNDDLEGIERIIQQAYESDVPGYISIPTTDNKKVFINLKETITIEIQKIK